MENLRTIAGFFLAALFLFGTPIKAYSPNTTHHGLTGEIIKLFEVNYSDLAFTSQEKEWIKNGSVDEDHDIRPMNHFYDPISGQGLWGFSSSRKWVNDTLAQANRSGEYLSGASNFSQPLFSSETDFSWDRAIYEYVHGDRQRSMEALGHVLHLVEDLTVPDHVRNDPHPPYADKVFKQASPYEGWTAQYKEGSMEVCFKFCYIKKKENLDLYFKDLSTFTNNNFFSKDTLSGYALPNASGEIRVIDNINYFERNQNKDSYYLVAFDSGRDLYGEKTVNLIFVDDNNLVQLSYWKILSKEAVQNGAGVVKLFFDEVEKEKETFALYNKNKSWLVKTKDNLKEKLAQLFNRDDNVASVATSKTREEIILNDEVNLEADDDAVSEEVILSLTNINPVDEAIYQPENHNLPFDPEPVVVNPVSRVVLSGQVKDSEDVEEDAQSPLPNLPILAKPGITEPKAFNVFNQSEIEVEGTSTPNAKVKTSLGVEDKVNREGEWRLVLALEEGTTTVEFWTENEIGKSESLLQDFYVDTLGPEISINAEECGQSISSSNCVLPEQKEVHLSWGSQEVAEYLLIIDGEEFSTTSTSTVVFFDSYGKKTVSVESVDKYGNKNRESINIEFVEKPIIISELSWLGTNASADDEWIELYNRTDYSINLSGWILHGSGTPEIIQLSGTLEPKSFFLLERGADDTISDIVADQIYTKIQLTNSQPEQLSLLHGSTTIDSTPTPDTCGNNWCAGMDKYGKYSMERYAKDPLMGGPGGWGTTLGRYILNGSDANGNPILGTPRSESSINKIVGGEYGVISSDTVITKEFSPYVVTHFGLTIHKGASLTLEEGVIIKMADANTPGIFVNGTLIVNGSEQEPVVITTLYDDEEGGDTDGFACEEGQHCPVSGSWLRLEVNNGEIYGKNFKIKYGGMYYNGYLQQYRGSLVIDNSTSTLENLTIEKSHSSGVVINNEANVKLINSYINHTDNGIFHLDGDILLENPDFGENGTDIFSANVARFQCIGCSFGTKTFPVDLLNPITPMFVLDDSTEELLEITSLDEPEEFEDIDNQDLRDEDGGLGFEDGGGGASADVEDVEEPIETMELDE